MRFSSCCLVRKDEYGEREPVVWAEQLLFANRADLAIRMCDIQVHQDCRGIDAGAVPPLCNNIKSEQATIKTHVPWVSPR